MKLPRVPTKIERMWSTLKWIHEWNWLGGATIYVDPYPEAMHLYRKLKKNAEKDTGNITGKESEKTESALKERFK